MFSSLLLLFHLFPGGFTFGIPDFWRDSSCKETPAKFNVGPKPHPFGTFGDEFNPKSPSYFFRDIKHRRIHYGVPNTRETFPFTAICNIMEIKDRYEWCTCIILSEDFVLTNRLCFRARPHDSPPRENLPPIKVTYGTLKKSTHNNTREVVEIYNHPNPDVVACLLRVHTPIRFTDKFRPISPEWWIRTTGWRNLIPKCSTLMCGYGTTEDGDADELKCVFYGFTTNIGTMNATGLYFEDILFENTRAWLGSVNDHDSKYFSWLETGEYEGLYASSCGGDAGAPVFYWDNRGQGEVFLIGMNMGNRGLRCGEFDVEMSISMIALTGWLAKFIDGVSNPLQQNKIVERVGGAEVITT